MSNNSLDDLLNIGGRLKIIREELGYNQKEFSDKIEVSLKTYQNYEKNKTPIPHTIFEKLHKIDELPYSAEWIINGTDSKYGGNEAIASYMNDIFDDRKKQFEEFIDRYMYQYIFNELEVDKVRTVFAPRIYYENRIKEYSFNEKLHVVSSDLEVDLINNQDIPYCPLLYLKTFTIAPLEWFIHGTIENIKYDFYDVLVKRTFLYKNEFQEEIIQNLKFAPQNFLEKLNEQLILFKKVDEEFFKKNQ